MLEGAKCPKFLIFKGLCHGSPSTENTEKSSSTEHSGPSTEAVGRDVAGTTFGTKHAQKDFQLP